MQESDSGENVPSERYWERMKSRNEDMEVEDMEYSGYTRNVEENRTWYSQSSPSGPSTSVSYSRSYSPVTHLNRRPISISMTSEASVIERYPAVMNSYNDFLTDEVAYVQREEQPSLIENVADSPSAREATPQLGVSRTEVKTTLRLNRTMAVQMPESVQLPDRGTHWDILTEDMVYPEGKPFDSMYEPAGSRYNASKLWSGFSRRGNSRVAREVFAVHARFDHVDLYRIIYVTTVFQTTVYNADEAFLSILAKVLTLAGRPHGYENTLPGRKPPGSSRCVYTAAELRILFNVIGNKQRADRDKTFIRVLKWVISRPNSPAKVLQGLPHAIIAMGEALNGYTLRWECKPFSFMYKLDPSSKLWYREDQ
jgi:hypothetical protein